MVRNYSNQLTRIVRAFSNSFSVTYGFCMCFKYHTLNVKNSAMKQLDVINYGCADTASGVPKQSNETS